MPCGFWRIKQESPAVATKPHDASPDDSSIIIYIHCIKADVKVKL